MTAMSTDSVPIGSEPWLQQCVSAACAWGVPANGVEGSEPVPRDLADVGRTEVTPLDRVYPAGQSRERTSADQ